MHLNPTLFSGAELEESGPIPWRGGSLSSWPQDGDEAPGGLQRRFPGSEEQLGMSPALCPGSPQDVQH